MNTASTAGKGSTNPKCERPGLHRRLAAVRAGFHAALRALRASNTPG